MMHHGGMNVNVGVMMQRLTTHLSIEKLRNMRRSFSLSLERLNEISFYGRAIEVLGGGAQIPTTPLQGCGS